MSSLSGLFSESQFLNSLSGRILLSEIRLYAHLGHPEPAPRIDRKVVSHLFPHCGCVHLNHVFDLAVLSSPSSTISGLLFRSQTRISDFHFKFWAILWQFGQPYLHLRSKLSGVDVSQVLLHILHLHFILSLAEMYSPRTVIWGCLLDSLFLKVSVERLGIFGLVDQILWLEGFLLSWFHAGAGHRSKSCFTSSPAYSSSEGNPL